MIDEIRKALAEATAGPWEYGIMEGYLVFDSTLLSRHIARIVPEGVESLEREEANAMLIANAPTWLRYLLDQLDEERAAHNAHATELCEQDKEIKGLRQKVADQESALLEVRRLLDWPMPSADEYAKRLLDQECSLCINGRKPVVIDGLWLANTVCDCKCN